MPVARLACLLKRDHARKGVAVTVADTTIAAVAIVHELTLMTDNVKDFSNKRTDAVPTFFSIVPPMLSDVVVVRTPIQGTQNPPSNTVVFAKFSSPALGSGDSDAPIPGILAG